MTLTSSTSHAPVTGQQASNAAAKLTSAAAQHGEGDFADILAGRHALLASSQSPTSPGARGDAAPAAGEFGALKLFQPPVASVQQSVGYSRQATSTSAAQPVADQANSNVGVTLSEDATAVPDLAVSPDQDATLAPNLADPLNPGVPGLTGVSPGQGIIPASGSVMQPKPAEPASGLQDVHSARVVRTGGAEPEAIVLPGSRRLAALPAEPAALTLGLFAAGKEAAVVGRIAGLGPAEADELHTRIREELAASRLGVREIRINGRLSGPPQESE